MAGRTTDVAAAYRAVAVTKSDSTVLPPTRGLYIGGTGDLAVIMTGDTTAVTFSAVPTGVILPLQVTKVMSANTTATLVLALY